MGQGIQRKEGGIHDAGTFVVVTREVGRKECYYSIIVCYFFHIFLLIQ
jgi:hypothetical protein